MDDLLIRILQQYGNQIIDAYRRKLYEGGSNATGLLGNSLSTTVTADDGVYEVILNIQDYWRYVEYGRLPGKFPNIDAIRKWIQVKPVIPNTYNGKLPTIDQLTYLISRKIALDGIEPRYYLNNTLDEIDLEPLNDAITRSLEQQLDNELRIIKNG
jgi:hypothetical protein